jgi:hypothetical protein
LNEIILEEKRASLLRYPIQQQIFLINRVADKNHKTNKFGGGKLGVSSFYR